MSTRGGISNFVTFMVSQGMAVYQACKLANIDQSTFWKWRQKYPDLMESVLTTMVKYRAWQYTNDQRKGFLQLNDASSTVRPMSLAKEKKQLLQIKLLELMRQPIRFGDACKIAKIHRSTVWNWRKQDKEFDIAFDSASLTLGENRINDLIKATRRQHVTVEKTA